MDLDRKQLQRRLLTATKMAKKVLINQDAYLQADAERKQLNLSKYRAKVVAELSDDSDDETEGNIQNVHLLTNFVQHIHFSELQRI